MRAALIGRTRILINTAHLLRARGHDVGAIWTCPAEPYYGVDVADFAKLADEFSVPFRHDVRMNSEDGIAWLKAADCGVALAVNWKNLVKMSVIDIFPHKMLNAHAGDLPRYRGNACPNWAILNGEVRIANTIHQKSADLDGGPVLLKRFFQVTRDTYIGDIHEWLHEITPQMFVDAVDGLEDGSIVPVPQSHHPEDGLRCYPRRPEDGRIDWRAPVDAIHRLVRASSRPFDGAFAHLEGRQKVTIWRADVVSTRQQFCAVPGQVCFRIDNDPVVAGVDGMLRLTDVSLEGTTSSNEAKSAIHKSLRNRLL